MSTNRLFAPHRGFGHSPLPGTLTQLTLYFAVVILLTINVDVRAGLAQGWDPNEPLALEEINIVGGEDADDGEYPFMVAVGHSQCLIDTFGMCQPIFAYSCGGTLVDPWWVLTAAHCVIDEDGNVQKNIKVLIGVTHLSFLSSSGTTIAVSEVLAHEQYDPESHENDIALLKLSTSSTAPVIKLYAPNRPEFATVPDLTAIGKPVTVIGWGNTAISGYGDPWDLANAGVLQELQLAIVDKNDEQFCNGYAGDKQLCTKLQAYATPCYGDSGGPLLANTGTSWAQVGINSFIYNKWKEDKLWTPCRDPATIYTEVARYIDWIAERTANQRIQVKLRFYRETYTQHNGRVTLLFYAADPDPSRRQCFTPEDGDCSYRLSLTTNAAGESVVQSTPLPSGVYNIYAKGDASLSSGLQHVRLVGGDSSTLLDFTSASIPYLPAGDYNCDDNINILDFAAFITDLRTNNLRSDFNSDGRVTIHDLVHIRNNYKASGKNLAEGMDRFCSPSVTTSTQEKPGILFLTPDHATRAVGEMLDVEVHLNTGPEAVNGADVVLRYDPCLMEVAELVPGNSFDGPHNLVAYPATGEIVMGVENANETPDLSGTALLATVRFRILAGQDPARLRVYFRPEETNESNAVTSGTVRDILGTVWNGDYSFTGPPLAPRISHVVMGDGIIYSNNTAYATGLWAELNVAFEGVCADKIIEAVSVYGSNSPAVDAEQVLLIRDQNRWNGWLNQLDFTQIPDQELYLNSYVEDIHGFTWSTQTRLMVDHAGPVFTPTVPSVLPADGMLEIAWDGSDAISSPQDITFLVREEGESGWLEQSVPFSDRRTTLALDPAKVHQIKIKAVDTVGNMTYFPDMIWMTGPAESSLSVETVVADANGDIREGNEFVRGEGVKLALYAYNRLSDPFFADWTWTIANSNGETVFSLADTWEVDANGWTGLRIPIDTTDLTGGQYSFSGAVRSHNGSFYGQSSVPFSITDGYDIYLPGIQR